MYFYMSIWSWFIYSTVQYTLGWISAVQCSAVHHIMWISADQYLNISCTAIHQYQHQHQYKQHCYSYNYWYCHAYISLRYAMLFIVSIPVHEMISWLKYMYMHMGGYNMNMYMYVYEWSSRHRHCHCHCPYDRVLMFGLHSDVTMICCHDYPYRYHSGYSLDDSNPGY